MADTLLIRALKGQPKQITLCNKNLEKIPKAIGKLDCVSQLQLKNNKIKKLPKELCHLYQLQVLNLGNNILEEFSPVLQHLHSLEKLHLFGNNITHIDGSSLNGFRCLSFLNLNGNQLKTLPSEICNLVSIQHLSVDNNLLTDLPIEFCALTTLEEFHAAGNKLTSLPLEIGYLISLEKLYLQRNKIRELPEGLGKCYRLRYIDVAANELRIFPTELASMPLKELHCEENPLLQNMPVHSVQEEEVLSLKELVARFVMKELKDSPHTCTLVPDSDDEDVSEEDDKAYRENVEEEDEDEDEDDNFVREAIDLSAEMREDNTKQEEGFPMWSHMRRAIRFYPDLRSMLAQSSKCAVCGDSFLNTWLECVKFVDARTDLKLTSMTGPIPVRALLCSYKCFNAAGHNYYGVAFP